MKPEVKSPLRLPAIFAARKTIFSPAPSREEVAKFLYRKGRAHSHAVARWERLESELLAQPASNAVTSNFGPDLEFPLEWEPQSVVAG